MVYQYRRERISRGEDSTNNNHLIDEEGLLELENLKEKVENKKRIAFRKGLDAAKFTRGKPIQKLRAIKELEEEEKRVEEFRKTHPDVARKAVETKFLTPEIKNFVETEQVKDTEKRVLFWLKAGYPIHIIGPTGCGKSALAMHVAQKLGRPVVWLNGDEQITTTDLIGGYSQVEQQTIRDRYVHNVFKDKDILKADWVDNPLTLACKYGYTLVYNEFSRTKPVANNILLSVFEEGILELPTKFGEERYIKVHPDFRAIFTSNPVEYAGVFKAQDALLDRLVGIYMDYYDSDTEKAIVRSHAAVDEEDAKKIVNVIRALRNRLDGAAKPGTRAAIMVARGLAASGNGYNKEYIQQLCFDAIASKTQSPQDLLDKQSIILEVLKKNG